MLLTTRPSPIPESAVNLGANTLTLSGGGSLVSGGLTLNNASSKLLLNSITVDNVSTSANSLGLDVDNNSTDYGSFGCQHYAGINSIGQ